MTNWNEADHPRDADGKFTYKNGGSLGNNHYEKIQNRADILYPTMKDEKRDKIPNYILGSFNDYKSLQDPANTVWYTLGSFLTNWHEMKDANTGKGL